MKKLLIICGPTATGKTKLSSTLAKKFDGELVSADSHHVHRGLDILTGKDLPTDDTKLWLCDVIKSSEPFSVAQYQRLARGAIADIQARGKLPILVGGTGLYIRAIVQPIDTASVPQNLSLRDKLNKAAVPELQNTLSRIDPKKWKQMNTSDRQNPRRLVRAIEVATWSKNHKKANVQKMPSYDTLWIGLTGSRELLKEHVEKRVRARFDHGVIEEVKRCCTDRTTALGFSIVRRYIAREIHKEEAIKRWTTQEFTYAKRQMTWFKKEQGIQWIDVSDTGFYQKVEALVRQWYTCRV